MDASARQPAWPSSSSIPDLATERLRLRAPLPRDTVALLALLGDPEVTKYIHNVVTLTTLTEAQAVLERLNQRYAARDMIRWAIDLVAPNEMIGTVGLLRFNFRASPRRAWVRYRAPLVGPRAHRRSGRGVIRYGFSVLGLHRIEAGVLPNSTAPPEEIRCGGRPQGRAPVRARRRLASSAGPQRWAAKYER
jgi:ribosomal-protein-alanine N-acetyltransferase